MPFSLYLLAMAVFAMGTSEFMVSGLLPDVAGDLGVSVGAAGALTSAFAVGMVVGAPLVGAFARGWPRRACLLGFLLGFAGCHVVGALTADFPLLLATRVIAAFANAGFLAVALTVAVELVPRRTGRALAVLLSGTTIAMVAGVPGGALLGAVAGWRSTFWAVAFLCVPAAFALRKGFPARDGTTGPELRAELAALRRPRLGVVMLVAAVVNAATFGGCTYLAPKVAATLGALWVPVVLVVFGVGSFVGVGIGGRFADRRPRRVVAAGTPVLLVGWPVLVLTSPAPVPLLLLVFLLGVGSFAVGSTLITRIVHEAADAPTMAGSYATVALNVGAVAGPLAVWLL